MVDSKANNHVCNLFKDRVTTHLSEGEYALRADMGRVSTKDVGTFTLHFENLRYFVLDNSY